MKRIVLAVVLSLGLSDPAAAADRLFDLIGVYGQTTAFVDVNSKTLTLPHAEFWVLEVNFPPKLVEQVPNLHYMVLKTQIDCGAQTGTIVESVAYDKANQIVASSKTPSSAIQIKPGSPYDVEYKYMCLGQRPHPEFKMLAHLKDAVAWADSAALPPADAPTPID